MTEGDMAVEQLDAIRRLIDGPKSWNFHLPQRGVTGYRRSVGIRRSGEYFELTVNSCSDGVYSGFELLEKLAEMSPYIAKCLAEPLGVPKNEA